ncbi:50S ribosomal protein L22 [Candidatus Micrarchaeota archaeon]|jgi:large subunit ribosomal protein L22|nr:50S ribosomal protein L22 [Candidatus Micrarchaeota archaeon]
MKKYMTNGTEKSAKARIEGVNASYKQLSAVCDNVKGMEIEDALNFLESAAIGQQVVRFRKHNKRMAHRKELGGQKGRWPKKASKIVLQVLKNAKANADTKGLLNPFVSHIAANKQKKYPRVAPRGKTMMANYETSFVEVILEEKV